MFEHLPVEMDVDVYRNLQTGTYSARSRETDSYGTVIAHPESVVVKDATLVVNEAGRQRVVEQNRKNVHAYVRGEVGNPQTIPTNPTEIVPITYDPYTFEQFVHTKTKHPIESAEFVLCHPDSVYAINPVFF